MTLAAIAGAWATFKSDVASSPEADERMRKRRGQGGPGDDFPRRLELSRRIVETQQNLTTTTVSINEGFREGEGAPPVRSALPEGGHRPK